MPRLIEVMPWVRRLPEVNTPILNRLAAVQRKVDEAEEAMTLAHELRAAACWQPKN